MRACCGACTSRAARVPLPRRAFCSLLTTIGPLVAAYPCARRSKLFTDHRTARGCRPRRGEHVLRVLQVGIQGTNLGVRLVELGGLFLGKLGYVRAERVHLQLVVFAQLQVAVGLGRHRRIEVVAQFHHLRG